MVFSIESSFGGGGVLLPILTLVIFAYLAKVLSSSSEPYNRFPRIHRPWLWPFSLRSKPINELIGQAYCESKEPFVIRWWAMDWLVLGPQYLQDLKHCESRSLSFFRALSEAIRIDFSVGTLYHGDKMADVVKKGMNTQLSALTPVLVDEIETAFEKHFDKSGDFQEIPLADKFSELVHQVACRVLICQELSCNDKFLQLSMNFSRSIFVHGMIMMSLPFFSRLIVLGHKRNLAKTMKVLQPVVAQRIAERDDKPGPFNDGIQWTLDLTSDADMDAHQVSLEVLHNLFAGSLAPGALVTEMTFQALMDPKLLQDLREEAQTALAECGWTDKLFSKLPLQDSFIRELGRVYPTGSAGCSRTVVDKSFTFSDGLTVPQGTRITFPVQAIMNDPQVLQNPGTFDAYRFLHLRDGGVEGQWSASSLSQSNLVFGYGKHACPGRWYTIRKTKLIFSKFILDYDLEWPSGMTERPQRVAIEGQFASNTDQKVRVRYRGARC